MSPKLRKTSNNAGSTINADSNLTCDGCSDTLQKKEALNCSVCKVWLHRYCAGVPKSRYSDISQSFLCIPCSLVANSSVVVELKNEVAALKAEVLELRSALEAANKKIETSISAHNSREDTEWSTVVKRNPRRNTQRRGQQSQTVNLTNRERRSDNPGAARRSHTTEDQAGTKHRRVTVPGVRRVYGGHSSTPLLVQSLRL